MTERTEGHDLEWIRADDLLLDALGRGEPGPDDDEVAAMLAAWRADLADELPSVRAAAPAAAASATAAAIDEQTVPISVVRARRRLGRPRALAVAASLTLIAALGGVFVAALDATPGSPLWPISQILNPDRADVLAAREAIGKVRVAIAQHRYGDATRLITQAQALVDKVHAATDRQRLQADLDALVRELAAKVSGSGITPSGPASATPTPTPAPTQAPAPGATGNGGGGAPAHSPTANGGGGLPGLPLPSLPLPSLPLPKLPLPSLPLPSLPIHIP
jgi:hypothetical protein